MPEQPANPPSRPPVSPAIDWLLFGVTAVAAALVYISIFNSWLVGFIVGEAICAVVWIGGLAYKWRKKRSLANLNPPTPPT